MAAAAAWGLGSRTLVKGGGVVVGMGMGKAIDRGPVHLANSHVVVHLPCPCIHPSLDRPATLLVLVSGSRTIPSQPSAMTLTLTPPGSSAVPAITWRGHHRLSLSPSVSKGARGGVFCAVSWDPTNTYLSLSSLIL